MTPSSVHIPRPEISQTSTPEIPNPNKVILGSSGKRRDAPMPNDAAFARTRADVEQFRRDREAHHQGMHLPSPGAQHPGIANSGPIRGTSVYARPGPQRRAEHDRRRRRYAADSGGGDRVVCRGPSLQHSTRAPPQGVTGHLLHQCLTVQER